MICSGAPIRRLSAFCIVVSCTATSAQQPENVISFEADSVSLSLQGGDSVFRGLSVSDGTLSIYAAEGTTVGNEAGTGSWHFSGGLRITVDTAILIADSATFRFSEGVFTQGELLGAPVVVDTPAGGDDAAFHGTAGRISYDGAQRVLSASEGASLAFRGVEVENCSWSYHLNDKSVSGLGESDDKCVARMKRSAIAEQPAAADGDE